MLTVVVATVAAAVSFVLVLSSMPHEGRVNPEKIVAATEAYRHEWAARGSAVPDSVPLETLIRRGFLKRDEVAGFDGMEVTVSLIADESRPQEFLMRTKLPDGHELVVLGDGSVQQLKK